MLLPGAPFLQNSLDVQGRKARSVSPRSRNRSSCSAGRRTGHGCRGAWLERKIGAGRRRGKGDRETRETGRALSIPRGTTATEDPTLLGIGIPLLQLGMTTPLSFPSLFLRFSAPQLVPHWTRPRKQPAGPLLYPTRQLQREQGRQGFSGPAPPPEPRARPPVHGPAPSTPGSAARWDVRVRSGSAGSSGSGGSLLRRHWEHTPRSSALTAPSVSVHPPA